MDAPRPEEASMRRALLLIVLIAVSLPASRADAVHLPTVVTTNTEILSTSPLQVRFTFALQNPADGMTIDNMTFQPDDGSHVLSCAAPPNWICSGDSWYSSPGNDLVAGTTAQPFQIVSD